jgi:hypothetical protein
VDAILADEEGGTSCEPNWFQLCPVFPGNRDSDINRNSEVEVTDFLQLIGE